MKLIFRAGLAQRWLSSSKEYLQVKWISRSLTAVALASTLLPALAQQTPDPNAPAQNQSSLQQEAAQNKARAKHARSSEKASKKAAKADAKAAKKESKVAGAQKKAANANAKADTPQ